MIKATSAVIAPASTTDAMPPITDPTRTTGISKANEGRYNSRPARRLPCGTVSVNGFSEGDIKTPFGGYKQSGSLARDNETEALEQYLRTNTIWISTGE